jgi:hypothetical protein
VVKKKVAVVSMSSKEAFPMTGLALKVEVPTTMVSIPGPKVGRGGGGEGWNSGLDARLEVVVASFNLEAVTVSI